MLLISACLTTVLGFVSFFVPSVMKIENFTFHFERSETVMMKNIPLYVKILAGMALGILLGFLAVWTGKGMFITDWITPWGTVFIRLLKMVAIPLVFISLVKGISGLSDIRRLSRMGLKTVGIYISTTVVAVCIGLLMVNIINPGKVFPRDKAEEYRNRYEQTLVQNTQGVQTVKEAGPLQFLVDIVPDNVIQAGGDNSKMLQIILIAVLFGVALVAVGQDKTAGVVSVIDGLNHIILKIIDYIMLYAPWGVLALMAGLVVSFSGDVDMFAALGLYVLTAAVGMGVIIFLFYPALIRFFTRLKPGQFFKAMLPVQLLAFSSSSSAATLPVTMEQTQRHLGVSNEVASFVLPVGVTINMDGSSCYQAVSAVFVAQVMGIDLSLAQMLTIVAVGTLSSIGTPGVPGGSIVMLMLVLGSVGIPAEGLALILGMDRPLDMLRTVVNVTGDATVACIVDHGEKAKTTV